MRATMYTMLTSDDDQETVNLASATIIFSSCALSFGLQRKCVILCRFKATCSLVNMGLTPLVCVPFVRLSADNRTNGRVRLFVQIEFMKLCDIGDIRRTMKKR